ncbi:hypothetical protein C2W62_42695 [Candidatus Entotheonella serta]|nr:hypothetical protein C2W62_42695 [Candidatus Entotheonella serta]
MAGQIARGVLQPAAEPIVHKEVQKDIRDHNWWQCALDLIHIDFLGGRADRVAMIKDRLSLP